MDALSHSALPSTATADHFRRRERQVVDGDGIVCATVAQGRRPLSNNAIVATVMGNIRPRIALRESVASDLVLEFRNCG